jgi:tetratricopeptide (TPR) repeat protein
MGPAKERNLNWFFKRSFFAWGVLATILWVGVPMASWCAGNPEQERGAGPRPGQYAEFQIVAPAPQEKNPDYFDALADSALQRHDWVAACETYDEALRLFPRHPRLRNNAAAVRDLWANAVLAKEQWDAALDACDNALERGLSVEHFRKKVTAIVQAAGRAYVRDGDLVGLEAWLAQARSRFSDFPGMASLLPGIYAEALAALPITDERYYLSQGTALILSYQNFQQAAHPDVPLVKDWCNRLLFELQQRQAWERALHLLQAARELLPDDSYLRKREISLWNVLAQESIRGKQWEFAALVYEQALDRFPQEALFQNNLKYCQQKRNAASTVQ